MSAINRFVKSENETFHVFQLKDRCIKILKPQKPIEPIPPIKPDAFIKDEGYKSETIEILSFDNDIEYCLSDVISKLKQHQNTDESNKSTIKFEVEKDYDVEYGAYKITIILKKFSLKPDLDFSQKLEVYEENLKQYEQNYKNYLINCKIYEQQMQDYQINIAEAEIIQLNEKIESLNKKIKELKR